MLRAIHGVLSIVAVSMLLGSVQSTVPPSVKKYTNTTDDTWFALRPGAYEEEYFVPWKFYKLKRMTVFRHKYVDLTSSYWENWAISGFIAEWISSVDGTVLEHTFGVDSYDV